MGGLPGGVLYTVESWGKEGTSGAAELALKKKLYKISWLVGRERGVFWKDPNGMVHDGLDVSWAYLAFTSLFPAA